MLTAKIGSSIINCFDGMYDRYRLKQWSSKGILKCPVCDGTYEYCHGEIVSPYFRHVGKECGGYYSEPETDEHRNGKIILYNWIKMQDGVYGCKLESWIPEIKQRPDIYFEYKGERFVIEYQCTPIASEFLKRRELYRLAGINDIWILGVNKYDIHINKGNIVSEKARKTIEKTLKKDHIIYFDSQQKVIFSNSLMMKIDDNIKNLIKELQYEKGISRFDLYEKYNSNEDIMFVEQLDNIIFKDNRIKLSDEIETMLDCVNEYYSQEYKRINQEKTREQIKIDEEKRKLERKLIKLKEKLNIAETISEHVGDVGKEISVNVLLVEKKFFWSYGGSTLYKLMDEYGNVLVWMTATYPNISVGDFFKITGRVKSHSVYEDVKQTRLFRCKIGIKVR